MKLKAYLTLMSMTEQDFATQLRVRGKPKGVGQQTVDLWVRGIRIPRRNAMKAIAKLTDGAVGPNDFYNIAA